MEHRSAIKRNEISIHATTCIGLENIILSKRSQTQNAMYFMIPFFFWVGGGQYWVSTHGFDLVRQALYHLSHAPIQDSISMKCPT
jgi:hypothetical protein